LDQYIDCTGVGLANTLINDVPREDAFPAEYLTVCEQIEAAIRERIWAEFSTWSRDSLADQRRVRELVELRGGELTRRLFRYP
jgi:hypothetical protein